MNDKKLMNLAADNIRILAASMVEGQVGASRRRYGRRGFHHGALHRVSALRPR